MGGAITLKFAMHAGVPAKSLMGAGQVPMPGVLPIPQRAVFYCCRSMFQQSPVLVDAHITRSGSL